MVIASPWSRGGWACSQVFDHTSVLQFLEKLVTHKTGKKIEESNISQWRRVVCGDLTSAFQPAPAAGTEVAKFPTRDAFVEEIHRARFKPIPSNPSALTPEEIEQVRQTPDRSRLPRQEAGVRQSCAIPYQLSMNGELDKNKSQFVLNFEAKKDQFDDRAAGAPFTAYATTATGLTVRHYAVGPGERLEDSWDLKAFEKGRYLIRVYGPNGFFREFAGGADDPTVQVSVETNRLGLVVRMDNRGRSSQSVVVRDRSYGMPDVRRSLGIGEDVLLTVDTTHNFGWYDICVYLESSTGFEKRFAGRVETGQPSYSDPAMA